MRKVLKTVIIFTILLMNLPAKAQQPAQYSLWQFNPHNFNPAYAGLDNSLSAIGVFRRQWVGLEGAPLSQSVNVHFPVLFMNSAFGFKFENDVLGAERNLTATASYAYQITVGNGNQISIGINGGILQKSIDGTLLVPPNQDNDVLIPQGNATAIAPIFAAGVFFKNENIKIGLSANNLLETSLPYDYTAQAGIQLVRNYFSIFAYKFEIGEFAIEPAVLLKTDLVGTQIDLSTIIYYGDKLFGGGSYRGYSQSSTDAVALFAGYKVSENVSLAYAYDVPLSALNSVNTGSHEIMLSYNLNKAIGMPLPARIIYNPRFTF